LVPVNEALLSSGIGLPFLFLRPPPSVFAALKVPASPSLWSPRPPLLRLGRPFSRAAKIEITASTMAELKTAQPGYGAPAPAPTTAENQYVQQTPRWVVVVRGFQALFAFVILAMCGYLIHGKAMDANVFALVVVSSRCLLPTRVCRPR
jgi:hypothetical protein